MLPVGFRADGARDPIIAVGLGPGADLMGLGVFVAGDAFEGYTQLLAHIGPGQVQDVIELHFFAH